MTVPPESCYDCAYQSPLDCLATKRGRYRVIGLATTAEIDETIKRINHALAEKELFGRNVPCKTP